MYSINYLLEKFTSAVYELATGEGDARSRVRDAYSKFGVILLEDYPEELRVKRKEIDILLTRLGGEKSSGGTINYNLQKMKNKTASKISMLIFNIYLELDEMQQNNVSKHGIEK